MRNTTGRVSTSVFLQIQREARICKNLSLARQRPDAEMAQLSAAARSSPVIPRGVPGQVGLQVIFETVVALRGESTRKRLQAGF